MPLAAKSRWHKREAHEHDGMIIRRDAVVPLEPAAETAMQDHLLALRAKK